MICVRRALERHRLSSGGQNLWLTFFPSDGSDPLANGFGALTALNEGLLRPEGNMLTYSRRGSDVITYVIEGTMSHQDRGRPSKLIRAGEFQCSSAKYSDSSIFSNASGREELHVLQLSLFSSHGLFDVREPQQRSFSPMPGAEQPLRLVGSSDGREGSLALAQDVQLYSGVFRSGEAFTYPLAFGRIAWIQVLSGSVTGGSVTGGSVTGAALADGVRSCGIANRSMLLEAGDGAGFSPEGGLSLRAESGTEIVLLDLGGDGPGLLAQAARRRQRDGSASGSSCAA